MPLPRPPTGRARYPWYVHHPEATVWANFVDGQPPQLTPTGSGSYTLVFDTDVTNADTLEWQDRYAFVRDTIGQEAGRFVAHEPVGGPPVYTDQSFETSPLVCLEPAYQSTQRGAWGLVESVSDGTTLELSHGVLEVSIYHLAPGDEYDDFAELRSARQE